MYRILIVQLKQEASTFNPEPSRYDDFSVHVGADLLRTYAGTATELAGAMGVFGRQGVTLVPAMAAEAVSGGAMAGPDWDRLLGEFVAAIQPHGDVDGAYVCLHGAMAAVTEDDPEGRLLSEVRKVLGPKPIVASLDLHAVLTDRMMAMADVFVPYHTYPHVDHVTTGERAAKVLLRLLRKEIRPTTARIALPMLVRGDELITATGRFGEATRACEALERVPGGVAAGVIIGNAFTDVPALQSYVIVTTDNDAAGARASAEKLARFMWEHRALFQAALTPLPEAIRLAAQTKGLTVFSDAADATASGASGDSNEILRGLISSDFPGSSLLSIVDAPAAARATAAGLGATVTLALGGTCDPGRFRPLTVTARVHSLHSGDFTYEDGTAGRAGPTAVLAIGRIRVLVTTRSVYVVGRKVFEAHGLDPKTFDVVVAKSPNGFRTWYQAIASRIVPVDVPGSTSANLKSLPYAKCVRPIYPLDADVPSPFAAA